MLKLLSWSSNLADLQTVNNRLDKVAKKAKATKDSVALRELHILTESIKLLLESGQPLSMMELNPRGSTYHEGLSFLDHEACDLCGEY